MSVLVYLSPSVWRNLDIVGEIKWCHVLDSKLSYLRASATLHMLLFTLM